MRILICDDDVLIIKQLEQLIATFFQRKKINVPSIVSYSDGNCLMKDSGTKDILFLDIEMPGMNGIYIGNELKKQNPDIIIFIVSAYSEYLDDAMRFHVFRYLTKPLDKQRFSRNMQDALDLYHHINYRIPVETKQGIFTLSPSEIITIEAIGRKVIVHTQTKDYESSQMMQYWVDKLPHNCFFQTHRSFIVNMEHISDFDHSMIHMIPSTFDAYLSRRQYRPFKDAYLLFLESMR